MSPAKTGTRAAGTRRTKRRNAALRKTASVAQKVSPEASVRYLARELGRKLIRVNAIPAGAIETRAASGFARFDELLNETVCKVPLRRTKHGAASGGDTRTRRSICEPS